MRNIRSRLGFIALRLAVAALALVVALVLIWGSGPAKQASAHFPHPGVDFSMSVGTQCDSTAGPAKCTFNPGETFTVDFKLNTLPAGLTYVGYDVAAYFVGVDILPATLVGVSPSCGSPVSNFEPAVFEAGCASFASTYTGVLLHVDFTCPSTAGSGTITLVHGPTLTEVVTQVGEHDFEAHGEAEGSSEALTITCGRPVGGISLDPQIPGSSESNTGLPAGAIAGAMAVVVITGGVWYARRRRVR